MRIDGADIKLPDSQKINFGTGNDLQIYHNGSTSHIDNSTGSISIRNNVGGGSSSIQIQAKSGEYSINAFPDAAVDLYYDNSKKFETTSTGATLTGALTTTGNINVPTANSVVTGSVVTTNATALTAVDNGTAYFGTGLDLRISHTGTNSYITNTLSLIHI